MSRLSAAVVTVGSELTGGLRVDTNTAEIARALTPRGFQVKEAISIGDDPILLAEELRRLCATRDLVVTTGGLGPTHDDITRQAAALALELELVVDERLEGMLRPAQARHTDARAAEQVLVQAQVLAGAEVIDFATGTAPGLVVHTVAGLLCLLPGPPSEMRPMLVELLARYPLRAAAPHELGVVGLTESDAQVLVQTAITDCSGVGFTILARPGDVRVILTDEGAGETGVTSAADRAAAALADNCYSTDGSTLAETVVRVATRLGRRIALAESCTGGMVAAALTDVPGSSSIFAGSVVSYSNEAKMDLLDVPPDVLTRSGAVSAETVQAMALGARRKFPSADLAVAISGIAGPDGGSVDKPVGTVWFAVAGHAEPVRAFTRPYANSGRDAVRARATSAALDCLRRSMLGLPIPG